MMIVLNGQTPVAMMMSDPRVQQLTDEPDGGYGPTLFGPPGHLQVEQAVQTEDHP